MARKKKNSRTVEIDFEGVESGGLVPEGEWLCEIEENEVKTSEDSGEDYIAFTGKTSKGKLWWNCSLQAKALFNLRGLLEACEMEIPDGPMDLDLDELVGCEFVAVVEHEKYKGKMKARVTDYMSADGYEEAEADDEEEEDDAEEEADAEDDAEEEADDVEVDDEDDLPVISEEELAGMDLKQLQAVIDKYELEVTLKKFRSARKKVGAVQDALEEAGYLEE